MVRSNKTLNILFSSAGRRVELIKCFQEDALILGIQLKIVACDADPKFSAACQIADASFSVPRCDSPDFIPVLVKLCERLKIDLLIPTIDTELLVLSEFKEKFASVGTEVIISSPEVVRVARDKLITARTLASGGIPTPKTATALELLSNPSLLDWPVILKPVAGSSSNGIRICDKINDVAKLPISAECYIAQTLWSGREFTVNMFFDEKHRLRSVVPHLRKEIRSGEVSKGITVRNQKLIHCGHALATTLGAARGPICFQAIVRPDDKFVVFEINARFGGGFPLTHRAGARFSKWILEEILNLDSTASEAWEEGVTMLRYDAAVFKSANIRDA